MLFIISDKDLSEYVEEVKDAFGVEASFVTPDSIDFSVIKSDDVIFNLFEEEPINLDLVQFYGYFPEKLKYTVITPICEKVLAQPEHTEVTELENKINEFVKGGKHITSLLRLHKSLNAPVLSIKNAITHSDRINYIGDLCNIKNNFILYKDLADLKCGGSVELSSEVLQQVVELSDYMPKLYNLGTSDVFTK